MFPKLSLRVQKNILGKKEDFMKLYISRIWAKNFARVVKAAFCVSRWKIWSKNFRKVLTFAWNWQMSREKILHSGNNFPYVIYKLWRKIKRHKKLFLAILVSRVDDGSLRIYHSHFRSEKVIADSAGRFINNFNGSLEPDPHVRKCRTGIPMQKGSQKRVKKRRAVGST